MPIIRPQDYYYLYSPWLSDPPVMFKYAIQALWAEGHVSISYKEIYANRNSKYKRLRTFIKLGSRYNQHHPYTKAERLIISNLNDKDMRIPVFYMKVMPELQHQIERFKTEYVYEDVKKNGWCFMRRLLTASGRKTKRQLTELLDEVDANIEDFKKTPKVLRDKIKSLGPNIILLHEDTLTALNIKVYELKEVMALFVPHNFYSRSGGSFGTNVGGGFGSSGGFGGYGGGSFGGGGSGGAW